MFEQQHINRIHEGVENWNNWRQAQSNAAMIELSQADLRKADLAGINLSQTDLREARFDKAHLQKSDLRGANLNGINLSRANENH